MFKKKQPKEEPVFKRPKIKESREIKTHTRARTDMEKIYSMFSIPNKRKTVFRMILSLPQTELDKNIYMLAEQLLKTLVSDRNIDKLLYSAFSRLIKSRNSMAIEKLSIGYLKAQMSYDKNYTTFLEFLIRHFKGAVVRSKTEIADFIEDTSFKTRILALEEKRSVEKIKYSDRFYYLRSK